jgi:serine/threonine protein kinase
MPLVAAEPPPRPVEYSPGQVLLAKYRLLEPLARGGMGEVWRAHNELLSCEVALKIMLKSGSESSDLPRRRAHSEARLAAQLRHPAVCAALDYGISEQGDPLVVSELLQGEGLDQVLLEQGPLGPVRAAQLLLPIVDALATAHDADIVHRDVKPSNLFLAHNPDGSLQPKLLDFGIAREVSEATHLTLAGSICGTPDYMSPEQARGRRDIDGRSDLWSVCATLYELVTGRVPFGADNYNAVIFAVVQSDPHPVSGLASADLPILKIIERGLSKAREDRYQSARELGRALAEFLVLRGEETDICGHSLRARLAAAEIKPVLPALKRPKLVLLHQSGSVPSREAKTEPRSSKRTERTRASKLWRTSVFAAAVALALGLGGWHFRNAPASAASPAAATVSEPVRFEPTQLASTTDEAASLALSEPPPAPATTAKPAPVERSSSERTTTGKRAKGVRSKNALGYDFGL